MDLLLEKWLTQNNIQYKLHNHPPVFTVEEARKHCYHIPGLHAKNLFLKDSKSKNHYLVTLPHYKRVEMKDIRKKISAKKLTLSRSEELIRILNLEPGSVSPFGLINDVLNQVIYIVDEDVWTADKVCFHPNINTATLELDQSDFHNAIKATNNEFRVIKFD